MTDEAHRNVAATRTFAERACREALGASLSENAFLSAFPDRAVTAHKPLLLQLRRELENLIVRETEASVNEWAVQNSLTDLFRALDRVTLFHLSAKNASDDDNKESVLASSVGVAPKLRVVEARIHSKSQRVARLEQVLSKREETVERLRAEAADVVNEYSAAQKRIESLSQQATATLSLLVE